LKCYQYKNCLSIKRTSGKQVILQALGLKDNTPIGQQLVIHDEIEVELDE